MFVMQRDAVQQQQQRAYLVKQNEGEKNKIMNNFLNPSTLSITATM